jgi:hypothetical protein
MRSSSIFIPLLLVAIGTSIAQADDTYICTGGVEAQNITLSYCHEYSGHSCCNNAQDSLIRTNIEQLAASVIGTDGCGQNFRALLCAWTCGNNSQFNVRADMNNTYNLTVYVDEAVAVAFYNSCQDRCFNFPGNNDVTIVMCKRDSLQTPLITLFSLTMPND